MLNRNALFILSFKGQPKETKSKVHCRGPHTVSSPFIRIILTGLGIVNELRLRPEYREGIRFGEILNSG